MHEFAAPQAMELWLADMRDQFATQGPDLLPLFETYQAEARFGREFIGAELERLARGASILEVGAGSMLLSCQLVREGFEVTALEPVGSGFSHFDRMRALVLERAKALGCQPQVLNQAAEDLAVAARFDFAFSVNVMEHVDRVPVVLTNVFRSLKPGGAYRFTCPNYDFPYEPHFNLPTLFSKRLTEKVLGRRILKSRRVPDPAGTWKSLNWISVRQIMRTASSQPGMRAEFDRRRLSSTLERIASDRNFAERRSPAMRKLLLLLVQARLHLLLRFIPARAQPIIDCRLRRAAPASGNSQGAAAMAP